MGTKGFGFSPCFYIQESLYGKKKSLGFFPCGKDKELKDKTEFCGPFLILCVCLLSGTSKTKIKLGIAMHRLLSDEVGAHKRGTRITTACCSGQCQKPYDKVSKISHPGGSYRRQPASPVRSWHLQRGDIRMEVAMMGGCATVWKMPDTWTWRRVEWHLGKHRYLRSIPLLPCVALPLASALRTQLPKH